MVVQSYDVLGMTTDKWIVIGLKGFPAVRLQYEYDDSKKPIKTSFCLWDNGSWIEKSRRTRNYDFRGKLEWIKENDQYLAKYTYTDNGNVREKEYFDNGMSIIKKSIKADVYGRVTEVCYKNASGKEIYSTKLGFLNEFSNSASAVDHSWKAVLGKGDLVRNGLYDYDYNDRLVSVSGSVDASYSFDEIGRMDKKKEGDTTIEFSYSNSSYRPTGYSVNGESVAKDVEYFRYDASGNIWYDKNTKTVYKNSELGQPVKITTFNVMPTTISLEDVDMEKDFSGVKSVVDVAYDEAGSRLWYSVDNRDRNEKWIEVTLPGIGTFRSENTDAASPTYNLVRQDLVAGAYRDASGNAHFPVLDAQGSVRGYMTTAGLESAYDYYPYGNVIGVAENAGDDNRRWQDKEFDGEHGKYYFGSRYFDPFFGMWMSPDPAGQFANPYSYGGDPVNFVDPNGEEAITAGVVVTAAIVGAIIGGSTAAYQCSKYGAGSCSVGVTQGITVGAASGAAGAAAGGAVVGVAVGAGEGAIGGGLAGGAAGSATSYIGNGLFTGDLSFGEGFRQTMVGGFSGAISGGTAFGLHQVPWFNLWETGIRSISSSVSSMATAIANGDNILDAGLSGLFWGAMASEANVLTSLALVYSINAFGGIDALNSFYGTENGEFMTEAMSAELMEPGDVSASVANDWLSILLAFLSGNGPFSHVRGMDKNGKIVENNNHGVNILGNEEGLYSIHDNRLTYVTKAYRGGQNFGVTAQSMKDRKISYGGAGLCVGATHRVNPYYKPAAPNAMFPWSQRFFFFYHY